MGKADPKDGMHCSQNPERPGEVINTSLFTSFGRLEYNEEIIMDFVIPIHRKYEVMRLIITIRLLNSLVDVSGQKALK